MSEVQLILAVVTILATFLVVYHHAVYPLILKVYAKRAQAVMKKTSASPSIVRPQAKEGVPSVEVIMPAFNEEATVAAKIENIAHLKPYSGPLSVRIICDGCTDATASIAQDAIDQHNTGELVTIQINAHNQGKIAVLNAAISDSTADIIVLSDISAALPRDSFQNLTRHFSDASVGAVSAGYALEGNAQDGEKTYWAFQSQIKIGEAALGAPLGAHGSLYAFRRDLFEPMEADTINDDFILPMRIVLKGYTFKYDPSITAVEKQIDSVAVDLKRRRRIAAGNVQQLIRLWPLLSPKYGGIAFAFFSGKALRVFMPLCLSIAFLGSLMLAIEEMRMLNTTSIFPIFLLSTLGQTAGYATAGIGALIPEQKRPKLVRVLLYILCGHASSFVGVVRYTMGLDRSPWKRA